MKEIEERKRLLDKEQEQLRKIAKEKREQEKLERRQQMEEEKAELEREEKEEMALRMEGMNNQDDDKRGGPSFARKKTQFKRGKDIWSKVITELELAEKGIS
jgi:hypothetical protein